uniref:Uncharacterized protein n=1 Tax=Raphanus sativus TaxID=3726 RepID=R9QTD1_RAPSA|nr:hypothetical protein DCGMS_00010 [Raphanus sativus]QGW48478.1 hypothetical protein [Raphanus sativus]
MLYKAQLPFHFLCYRLLSFLLFKSIKDRRDLSFRLSRTSHLVCPSSLFMLLTLSFVLLLILVFVSWILVRALWNFPPSPSST